MISSRWDDGTEADLLGGVSAIWNQKAGRCGVMKRFINADEVSKAEHPMLKARQRQTSRLNRCARVSSRSGRMLVIESLRPLHSSCRITMRSSCLHCSTAAIKASRISSVISSRWNLHLIFDNLVETYKSTFVFIYKYLKSKPEILERFSQRQISAQVAMECHFVFKLTRYV